MKLIFDFDGTLVDSAPAILAGFRRVLSAHDLTAVCALDDRLIGPPLLPTLSKLSGVQDPAQLDAMADTFRAWYDSEGFRETGVYPAMASTLQTLHQRGEALYLATNKRLTPTLAILDFLGWRDYFSAIYAIDSRQPAYPDKSAMLAELLREHAITAGYYIGDTEGDRQAAEANALQFVGVAWGYGALAGDGVLQSASELLAVTAINNRS